MRTLLFTCGVLTLLGCCFVDAQAQTALGQSWIITSSALYRDAGQFGATTVTSSMPAPPALSPDRDDTGLIQPQGDGFLLERGLAEQIDNTDERNVRVRERGRAICPMDAAAASDADLIHRDPAGGRGVDLFDELELVLAFDERPSGSVMPEADLDQVGRICPGDGPVHRYLLVGIGKTLTSDRRGPPLADPTVQPRPLADQSAKGS
jgi:hypothetical protein